MRRAKRSVNAALFTLMVIACNDAPSSDTTAGAATTPCAPLSDPATPARYAGVTSDGHFVVITGAPRAFYGVASHMVEGRITSMSDSCTHEVDFNVQGRSYRARFAGSSCDASVQASELVIGDGDVGVAVVTQTLAVVAPSASSLTFFCF